MKDPVTEQGEIECQKCKHYSKTFITAMLKSIMCKRVQNHQRNVLPVPKLQLDEESRYKCPSCKAKYSSQLAILIYMVPISQISIYFSTDHSIKDLQTGPNFNSRCISDQLMDKIAYSMEKIKQHFEESSGIFIHRCIIGLLRYLINLIWC